MSRLLTRGFFLCCLILFTSFTGLPNNVFPSVNSVSAQPNVPYTLGNWTYVNKPVLPVYISESQIPVGSNWTYVYTLEAGSAYRVYCYGDWIDYSTSVNKTDYDIFVYDPDGNLQSYHTEAAGLPEHLGTTVDHPFFIPERSGNFSFLITNDARESLGAKAATLMLIEHVQADTHYRRYLEGKINDQPVENTTWAYEFNTTNNHIEVWIDVPNTLDMYEARLYLMANSLQEVGDELNGLPLAWEKGLYGVTSDFYGGYNLDSEGFRLIEAMASCEYPGEDMFINYTSPVEGNTLYHLALIAEHGAGTIDFRIKTDFETLTLNLLDPTEKVYPNIKTTITARIEEQTNIETVTLQYTKNAWATSNTIEMSLIQNQIYTAEIPGQPAGTKIEYQVTARDSLGNTGKVNANYEVKNPTNITFDILKTSGYLGENISLIGTIPISQENVTLTYSSENLLVSKVVLSNSEGIFGDDFYLNQTGNWTVMATFFGNENYFEATSENKSFAVYEVPPPKTYVNKPVLPVYISESQIPVGSNWTYVYTLEAGSAYRVYCYGDWIDYSTSVNKTDYDIFVYDPDGNLQSYHTEAAGLPEHVGSMDSDSFFIPEQTGNYTFQIKNDLKESGGAKAATLMIIEHILPNKWYQLEMEGKIDEEPVEKTTWAYEFNTTRNFEIWIKVPETLDMYEARVYSMANPQSDLGTILNEFPLAWEPGLYANTSNEYGGFNLDSDGVRNSNALASCEYSGDDMLINFTATDKGNLLYHLALIAEYGKGTIEFIIKTDFEAPELTLVEEIKKTIPNIPNTIRVNVSEQSDLKLMVLNYTKDNWETYDAIQMDTNQTNIYIATIPGQPAGTIINYTIMFTDVCENHAEILSDYSVKNMADVTLELSSPTVEIGRNVTIIGSIPISQTNLTLNFALLNTTLLNSTKLDNLMMNNSVLNYIQNSTVSSKVITSDSSGNYYDQNLFNETGTWLIWATWNGTEEYFNASSFYKKILVQKMNVTIACNVTASSITIEDNITVIGSVTPPIENLTVGIVFVSRNSTINHDVLTGVNGTFKLSWKPNMMGLWQVSANITNNSAFNSAFSNENKFTVTDTFLNQYMIFIMGGVAGVCGVAIIIFLIKRRQEEE